MEKKATFGIMLILLLVGMLTLISNFQPVKASGTIYIRADGSIDPPTVPITSFDNITYTFTGNIYDSIVVERSNIVIDGNGYTLQGTGASESRGISLTSMNNVTIKGANIKNFDDGIRLEYSSSNVISGNNIVNNFGGSDGIVLSGSSSNSIYRNNFINSTHQVYIYAPSLTNTWDNGYPSGGNYWSNYAGSDFFSGPDQNVMGSDRIGDTHYIIDGNNQDRYPLMEPWTPAGIPTQYTWPMFRHNLAHTGYTKSPAPETNQTLWIHGVGANSVLESSPAVVDGKVFVGSTDGKVYCLDALTGAQIWNYPTGGDSVKSSPAVVDGKVYVGSRVGKVLCLDALTGALIWNYTTQNPIYFDSSPAVVDGKVYIASLYPGRLYCLDASSGSHIWNFTTGGHSDIPDSPAIAYGRVYIATWDNNLYCLDATTGSQMWNYTTPNYFFVCPTVAMGRVYIGSGGKLFCLSALTGAYLWETAILPTQISSPAVAYDRIYIGANDAKLHCLNAYTGSSLWNFTMGSSGIGSSPAVADGKVYIGSSNSCFYCLDAFSGLCIWSYKTNANVNSSPAIADGIAYVCDWGRVIAFGNIVRVPEDYPTIQGAIDASTPNGTVIVAPGIYNEMLTINKSLTLLGKSGSSTTFAGGGSGIAVTITNTYDVTITNVVITNFEKGVFVDNSHNCTIYNNMMYQIADSGIKLQGDNALTNIIYDNIIYVTNIAINVTDTSTGNLIYGNTISGNNIGIKLSHSTGNTIYWNTFDNNAHQVSTSNPSGNVWDKGYPDGGNYWSDYQGTDTDGDGIGDTPHIIDAYNQDRYPLMKAYGWTKMTGDVNGDEKVDASDLRGLSGAFGSKPGDNHWNANCDFHRDNKIEVLDLYGLGKNYGSTPP